MREIRIEVRPPVVQSTRMLVLPWAILQKDGTLKEISDPKKQKIVAEWNSATIISFYKETEPGFRSWKLWKKLLNIKRLTAVL